MHKTKTKHDSYPLRHPETYLSHEWLMRHVASALLIPVFAFLCRLVPEEEDDGDECEFERCCFSASSSASSSVMFRTLCDADEKQKHIKTHFDIDIRWEICAMHNTCDKMHDSCMSSPSLRVGESNSRMNHATTAVRMRIGSHTSIKARAHDRAAERTGDKVVADDDEELDFKRSFFSTCTNVSSSSPSLVMRTSWDGD